MKKILIILTTILLSISIVGCSNFNEKYDKDIDRIIEHINKNENVKDKPITRNDINLIIYNIDYDAENLKGQYYTYQISYVGNTKKEEDPSNKETFETKFFLIKGSEITSLPYIYNNSKKVHLYSENNIHSDRNSFDEVIIIGLVAGILLVFGLQFYFLKNKTTTQNNKEEAKEEPKEEAKQEVKNIVINVRVSSKTNSNITNKKNSTNKVDNKTMIPKYMYSLLLTYTNIVISFLMSISIAKWYSTLKLSSRTIPINIEDMSDIIFFGLIIIFILALLGLFLLLAKIYENKLEIFCVTLSFIPLLFYFFSAEARTRIYLLFLFFLSINYVILKSLPKLYNWLHTSKNTNQLDPAKLTLVWTIVTFLLGILFNLKI